MSNRPRIVIVTGLSGAGLSTAIHTLQDNGFYCIDNLPIELLWDTVALIEAGDIFMLGARMSSNATGQGE